MTGFLAFGAFAENPSAVLARGAKRPFDLLEVAYSAADAFVESFAADRFDRVVLMGVAGNSSAFRLEQFARNVIGRTPDVRGIVPSQRLIEASPAPELLPSTLWQDRQLEGQGTEVIASDDAGDYLCNYLYRRMLSRWPTHAICFLHVPPVEAMPIERQRVVLARLLDEIESPMR